MAEATMAGAPPCRCLPEDVAVWEILVRLPPKSLLRCRAVCRAWRRATSTREFLLAHHARQPSLQIVWAKPVSGSDCSANAQLLAFDHRAAANAQLQPAARLDESYWPLASCDGLLILSKLSGTTGACYTICNPVTREHSPLSTAWDFNTFFLLGMYQHRPTGEYRLLLHRTSIVGYLHPKGKTGCYVFVLGSDQPPRHIRGPDAESGLQYNIPTLVRDSLHWFPVTKHQSESRFVLAFDITTETFRQMCVPLVSTLSKIFDMDSTLGIYSCNKATMQVVDVWELQNYEGEVWKYKYRVKLPVAEIQEQLGRREVVCCVGVFSVDGDVFLLINQRGWMFYVNTDGKIVDSIHPDGQRIYVQDLRLKQTLVPHNFLMTPKDSAMNASPFL